MEANKPTQTANGRVGASLAAGGLVAAAVSLLVGLTLWALIGHDAWWIHPAATGTGCYLGIMSYNRLRNRA